MTISKDHFYRALDVARAGIDPSKRRRYVSGIALSCGKPNRNGDAYAAEGMCAYDLPLPLLIEHNPLQPIGIVHAVDAVRGGRVWFKAELMNDDELFWSRQAWTQIREQ